MIPVQLSGRYPFESRAAKRLGFVLSPPALEELQVHRLFGVFMRDTLDELSDRHLDSKFFPQFPLQALLKSLVRLAFATWELPSTTKMGISLALCDQKLASAKNQAGRNVNDMHGSSGLIHMTGTGRRVSTNQVPQFT